MWIHTWCGEGRQIIDWEKTKTKLEKKVRDRKTVNWKVNFKKQAAVVVGFLFGYGLRRGKWKQNAFVIWRKRITDLVLRKKYIFWGGLWFRLLHPTLIHRLIEYSNAAIHLKKRKEKKRTVRIRGISLIFNDLMPAIVHDTNRELWRK